MFKKNYLRLVGVFENVQNVRFYGKWFILILYAENVRRNVYTERVLCFNYLPISHIKTRKYRSVNRLSYFYCSVVIDGRPQKRKVFYRLISF